VIDQYQAQLGAAVAILIEPTHTAAILDNDVIQPIMAETIGVLVRGARIQLLSRI
jgi:hypothetical protein